VTDLMPQNPPPKSVRNMVERLLERCIFGSRWLLAPFYVGLAASLIVLLIQFAIEAVELFAHAMTAGSTGVTLGVLSLIDLSLMANLVLMVILAGYESFISRLDVEGHEGRLEWMGRIGFSDLKLKLMASIVAISAIHLLEGFMNADHASDRSLGWRLGIHITFVISGVLLAAMDRLSGHASH
jgi:uncharacterized protein (TIGR00645 family)